MRLTTTAIMASLIFFLIAGHTAAKNGDIRHVVSHNRTKVVTDPSKGVNPFDRWGVFPSRATEYRKVILYVTYQCPDSQHCGEWDYIDAIYLRRLGGAASPARNLEIARLISPYGSRFSPSWRFTWHVDVTDFASLLHDSVEVEFSHGGYEKNDDRGWLITLDFELTEGTPAMTCIGMDTLWQGSIPYGDSSKPLSASLPVVPLVPPPGASIARLRILQTGHGMDDSANCAEFCDKYRRIFLNDSLIDQRQIWRKCGDNPLYPQAGTWIYDRANWCPGSMVAPDCYDLSLPNKSHYSLRLEMEPYLNPNHPSASYQLSSYVFYYKRAWAKNDVALDEIIAPTNTDENSRRNPICADPRIVIKNNGREPLTSVVVKYGMLSTELQRFVWNGRLAPQRTEEIRLPGPVVARSGLQQFEAILESPNGYKDQYPQDNRAVSSVMIPPTYPTRFILSLRTNNDSAQTGYELLDPSGQVVCERRCGSLASNRTYTDTFTLPDGCYRFHLLDLGGDGLDFWANPDGGYGFARFLDTTGRLIKSLGSDFGSEINLWFTTSAHTAFASAPDTLPLVSPFPARNKGQFTVDIFQNDSADLTLSVVTEDSGKTVFEQRLAKFKEGFVPVDIAAQPDGIYFVKVSVADRVISRRIRVKHQD